MLGAGASGVAELAPEIRARLADVAPPATLEPDAARFRLFDGVTRFLKNAATHGTLVLDDLHWADAPSLLLLLRFLARELGSARLLVIGTYRDVEVDREHPLFATLGDLTRESVTRRLTLGGFDASDLASFVEATAGAVPSGSVAQAVLSETDGNPFFVGEVVRLLVADGGVESLGREAAGRLRPPETVREVIGRRLARLSPECNGVLEIASVIGREFVLTNLHRLSDLSRDRMLAVLDEANAARIVVPVPETLAGYRFAHALVRETFYEEAVLHYQRALQALDPAPDCLDDHALLALLRALGTACLKADVPPEAKLAPLERAVELAERIGEPELLAATALEYHAAVSQGPLARRAPAPQRCPLLPGAP